MFSINTVSISFVTTTLSVSVFINTGTSASADINVSITGLILLLTFKARSVTLASIEYVPPGVSPSITNLVVASVFASRSNVLVTSTTLLTERSKVIVYPGEVVKISVVLNCKL